MDRDIELRHLRYFVAVAEELHFGRAAARLHLAQPPLSQQIRRLEDLLGYPLFERTSRSVALTAAGTAFLQTARETLRKVDRDLEEARTVGRGEVGSLHVGFVGSAMLTLLPAIFRTYRQAFPQVRLHLHESFTSRVLEGLASGLLDAGILRDGDPTEGIAAAPVFSEPFLAILPSTHPHASASILSPADLRNDPLVYYPRSAGTRAFEKPLTLFEQHGFRPHIVQEATHWLTIVRLVGAGLGISVAPACVQSIASPDVVCIPFSAPAPSSQVELATRRGESRPIVRAFTLLVQQSASSNLP